MVPNYDSAIVFDTDFCTLQTYAVVAPMAKRATALALKYTIFLGIN